MVDTTDAQAAGAAPATPLGDALNSLEAALPADDRISQGLVTLLREHLGTVAGTDTGTITATALPEASPSSASGDNFSTPALVANAPAPPPPAPAPGPDTEPAPPPAPPAQDGQA